MTRYQCARNRARNPRNHPAGDAHRRRGAPRGGRDARACAFRPAVDSRRPPADAHGSRVVPGRQPADDVERDQRGWSNGTGCVASRPTAIGASSSDRSHADGKGGGARTGRQGRGGAPVAGAGAARRCRAIGGSCKAGLGVLRKYVFARRAVGRGTETAANTSEEKVVSILVRRAAYDFEPPQEPTATSDAPAMSLPARFGGILFSPRATYANVARALRGGLASS